MSIYQNARVDVEDLECGWGRCRAKPADNIGICRDHAITAYLWYKNQMPTLEEMASAGNRQAQEKLQPRRDLPWHRGLIYALQFGTLIKIGFSTNIESRLKALPHDEVLGVMAGSLSLELMLHKNFVPYRHKREWYRDCPEIRQFIADNMAPYEG